MRAIQNTLVRDKSMLEQQQAFQESSSILLYPVESRILLGNYPSRYYLVNQEFDLNDCVKFRYLLDSASNVDEVSHKKAVRMRSATCRDLESKQLISPSSRSTYGNRLDSVASAMVTKLELSNQQLLKQNEIVSKCFATKVPDRVKLLQFDGTMTYIPPEMDPIEYFNSTTARDRHKITVRNSTKEFKEKLQKPRRSPVVTDDSIKNIDLPNYRVAPPSLSMYSYYDKNYEKGDTFLPNLHSMSSSSRPKSAGQVLLRRGFDESSHDEEIQLRDKKEKIARERKHKKAVFEHRQFAVDTRNVLAAISKRENDTRRKTVEAALLEGRKKIVQLSKKNATKFPSFLVTGSGSESFDNYEYPSESAIFDLSHEMIPMKPGVQATVKNTRPTISQPSSPPTIKSSPRVSAAVSSSSPQGRSSSRRDRFSTMRDSFDTDYLLAEFDDDQLNTHGRTS